MTETEREVGCEGTGGLRASPEKETVDVRVRRLGRLVYLGK